MSRSGIQQPYELAGDSFTRIRALYVWDNPGKLIDRYGRVIDVGGEVWPLSDYSGDCYINWKLVTTAMDVKDSMKAYLGHVVESQSPRAAFSVFTHIKKCLSYLSPCCSLEQLSYADLERVLVKLRSGNTAWEFGHLRRWYRWCCDRGIPGFRVEVARDLYKIKVPPNSVGKAVQNRDPARGPLSDEEHWLLRQAIKSRKGPLLERVCVMILLELGARPGQLTLLDEQNYRVVYGTGGQKFCSLDVSRLKQRTIIREKKRRRISTELGEAIEELIQENRQLYGPSESSSPMLRMRALTKKGQRITSLMVKYRAMNYSLNVGLISSRTGEVLNLFPYRLRYTFGTRHANQGTPSSVLAELLDHDDLNSVGVYTRATSNSVERLNHALGSNSQFTTLVDRFLGEIVERSESEVPHKMINGATPTLKNLGGLGRCGADFLCNLMPPLSCYVCPKFRAWNDGPHEEMLLELEAYKQQLTQKSSNPSDRIPIQLNETIDAVKALLRKLQQTHSADKNHGRKD